MKLKYQVVMFAKLKDLSLLLNKELFIKISKNLKFKKLLVKYHQVEYQDILKLWYLEIILMHVNLEMKLILQVSTNIKEIMP
jgi:hypothetical protein